jgi:hypothetical protein
MHMIINVNKGKDFYLYFQSIAQMKTKVFLTWWLKNRAAIVFSSKKIKFYFPTDIGPGVRLFLL